VPEEGWVRMVLATERAVLLRYRRDDGWRRGSGLRIGGTLVLTAGHCARGGDHSVVVGGEEYPAVLAWSSGRADVDIAVLDVPGLGVLEPLSCARVNTGVAARVPDCVALGFPTWNDRDGGKRRAQVDGYVATGEGADPQAPVGTAQVLTFKITTPAIGDRPVDAGDLDREGTPWGGMSGAVIVTGDDQIVGVVRGHAPAAGAGSLTFTPLAAIDVFPGEQAARFWGHLGVVDPHALPVLPLPEMASAVVVVVGQIPACPPGFVRRDTVDQLAAELLGDGSVAVVCAVTGMRGVGKTQVAAALARSWMQSGRGLVGWVNAETLDGAVVDLARIAATLGVADPEGDSVASARRLAEYLATRRGESLLVFDNAADPDGLRGFVPVLGRTRVVITTTDTAFTEFGRVIDVEQFERAESLRYLAERTGIEEDAAGAEVLAGELGDLPLALAAAAATMRQRRYPDYSRYLEQLRGYPVERVLRRPAGQDYQRSTAAALALSIDSLARDDPTGIAGRLLGVVSVLSPDGVRTELLQTLQIIPGGGESGTHVIEEAIEVCTRHSLLSWSVRADALILHRLTARVLRERAAATGVLGEAVTDALNLLESQLFDESQAWARRDLGAHLVAQIEALAEAIGEPDDADTALRALTLRGWAVRQLSAAADLSRAIDIGQRALADCERVLGAEHPDTLASRNNLAYAYRSAGRVQEAIPLFERTLAECVRVLGADHPQTLTSRSDLAGAYESAGRLDEAIGLFERTLAECVRVLGADHPDTLGSRNNLADAYRSAGRVQEAIPLFERTLAECVRVLGADHPHTLISRHNLADAYESAGRLQEAIGLHDRTLADRERVLGADHPDTLASRNNLAGAYESAGRLQEAITLWERTLADRERVLGADHPQTLASRNNLAGAYRSAGRLDEAIGLFERTLADCVRVLGADHPQTLASRNNLAGAYRSAGRVQEAIPLFERTLAECVRVLGADHPQTLGSRNNLACAYESAGRVQEAITLFERTLADRERVLGADHPDTLTSRNNLAGAYRAGGGDRAV
jgi:tetratricopeptide (TPR) repeat protein